MIQLTIRHLDHTAKLKVPAEYERVVLALWTLGLDRDPEKYTLRQLSAEFTFDTDEECRMVLLIDQKFTLRYALGLLSQMMFPPYPVAERIHKKMAAGEYSSEEDFFIEMENLVYDSKLHQHYFYFPVSGEVVDKKGLVRKASDKMLLEYEHLICEAIYRVQRQMEINETRKRMSERGFEVQHLSKEEIKRLLAIYFGASMDGDKMPDVDGGQYIREEIDGSV